MPGGTSWAEATEDGAAWPRPLRRAPKRASVAGIMRAILFSALLALVLGFLDHPARAEPTDAPTLSPPPGQDLVDQAAQAVRRMRARVPDQALDFLLARARGVMVFPGLLKASFIGGFQAGNGVMASRDATGFWSAPAFLTMAAGSAGFQAGVWRSTLVVVLMTEEALESALDSRLTLGADAGLLFGGAGGTLPSSTELRRVGAVAFSEAQGLFAGASFEGGTVQSREDLNQAYFGTRATAREVVVARTVDAAWSQDFKDALAAALGDHGPDQLAPEDPEIP